LQLKRRPKGYDYVVIDDFDIHGCHGIRSREDGRIVGYLDTETAESITNIPLIPSEKQYNTAQFEYFLRAMVRFRISMKIIAKKHVSPDSSYVDSTLSMVIRRLIKETINKFDYDTTANQQMIAKQKLSKLINTAEKIETVGIKLFLDGRFKQCDSMEELNKLLAKFPAEMDTDVIESHFIQNLYLLEFALRWMDEPKLKLSYSAIGKKLMYVYRNHEDLNTEEAIELSPCEVIFPACVYEKQNKIPRIPAKQFNICRMMVYTDPKIQLTPKPPPSRIGFEETEEEIDKFLHALYEQLRQSRFHIEIPRLFVEPVTLWQYILGKCDINTVAEASTKMLFYPLIKSLPEYDLVLIFYKPFGSVLFSAELKKRLKTSNLELRYIADQNLYSEKERDAVAGEIKQLFVRMIKDSVHCEKYNRDKRHSRETCQECKEVQKRSTRMINEMASIHVTHHFYQQALSYPDLMNDYFLSDKSFSHKVK